LNDENASKRRVGLQPTPRSNTLYGAIQCNAITAETARAAYEGTWLNYGYHTWKKMSEVGLSARRKKPQLSLPVEVTTQDKNTQSYTM